jgi:cell division protein FtsZ
MVETQQVQMRPRPVVLRTGTGNEVVDYAQPEHAVATQGRTETGSAVGKGAEPGFDYLDIPAFLRRQAD